MTDLEDIEKQFEKKGVEFMLKWIWDTYGSKAIATSSFQTQSLPLLHLISRMTPKMEIVFLDTGYHFEETYEYVKKLRELLSLNILMVQPEMGHQEFKKNYAGLYSTDPESCCRINKVEPLEGVMRDRQAWVSGIRRDQSTTRMNAPLFHRQENGQLKISPMIHWTGKDVEKYIQAHELPVHPLLACGYKSIGCWPCTKAVGDSDNYRSGRWFGSSKTECGLHNYYKKK